jgi:hypothetical protein
MQLEKIALAASVAAVAAASIAAAPAQAHPEKCEPANAASSLVYEVNHLGAEIPVTHGVYDATVSPALTAVECTVAAQG